MTKLEKTTTNRTKLCKHSSPAHKVLPCELKDNISDDNKTENGIPSYERQPGDHGCIFTKKIRITIQRRNNGFDSPHLQRPGVRQHITGRTDF